jgi:hypothetical protein
MRISFLKCQRERVGVRERERQREWGRERERERERETERVGERERETERVGERERETERDRDRGRERETERERERDREGEGERERDGDREKERNREGEGKRERGICGSIADEASVTRRLPCTNAYILKGRSAHAHTGGKTTEQVLYLSQRLRGMHAHSLASRLSTCAALKSTKLREHHAAEHESHDLPELLAKLCDMDPGMSLLCPCEEYVCAYARIT